MSSGINKTLSSIPIKVIGSGARRGVANFGWKRRAVQITILLLLVLIPVSGLFRIDPEKWGVGGVGLANMVCRFLFNIRLVDHVGQCIGRAVFGCGNRFLRVGMPAELSLIH